MRAVKLCTNKNPPVLNWRCRLTPVGLHNGRETGGWLVDDGFVSCNTGEGDKAAAAAAGS